MKVLLTGSAGYIGAILAPTLSAAGHDVVGLDSGYYDGCDFGSAPDPITSLGTDLRDVTATDLTGLDAVVHYAALSNDPLGELDRDTTLDINLEGTLRLARAARLAGVGRFVFASSCSMYGASGSDRALDEHAPLRPLTTYAESKVRAEQALLALADGAFCPVSMRNATVYGVSPRLRLDIVLNNLAGWAVSSGRIRLLSDGGAWRPLIHVRDVALVTARLLEAPADLVRGEAINVGSDEQNYRIRELADVVSAVSGCSVELAGDASADPRSYRVDFSKLTRVLPNLRLEWDAERGARELVAAYERHGLTSECFEGRRFVRLRQLQHLRETGALTPDLRWSRAPLASPSAA